MDRIEASADSISNLKEPLLELNDYSIIIRYPSHVTLEEQDAVETIESVSRIRILVSPLLT